MITHLLLFGASGDLARRFLFPALATLRATGRLPEQLAIVGPPASRGTTRRSAAT